MPKNRHAENKPQRELASLLRYREAKDSYLDDGDSGATDSPVTEERYAREMHLWAFRRVLAFPTESRDIPPEQEAQRKRELIARSVWSVLTRDPLEASTQGEPKRMHGGKKIHPRDPFARLLFGKVLHHSVGKTGNRMPDFDVHSHPATNRPDAECPPYDEGGLFGGEFADALHGRINHLLDDAGTMIDAVEGRDPLLVTCVIKLFDWIDEADLLARVNDEFQRQTDPEEPMLVMRTQLARAMLLSPLWIRPLETWQPSATGGVRGNIAGLLAHLFIVYPVPRSVVDHCINHPAFFRFFLWFVLIGRGASLHRVAAKFGWKFPRGYARYLFEPEQMGTRRCYEDIAEATRKAEANRLGARDEVVKLLCPRICRDLDLTLESTTRHEDYGFPIDPGELMRQGCHPPVCNWDDGYLDGIEYQIGMPAYHSDDHPLRHFFEESVNWFERNWNALSAQPVDALKRIFAWLRHKEAELALGNEAFTWKRRTVANVLRESREYEGEITRRNQARRRLRIPGDVNADLALSWNSKGFDWEYKDEAGDVWKITELTTAEQLDQEGAEMHHCVGGMNYHSRCADGRSAIFSLRQNELAVATLELDMEHRAICQQTGKSNRRLNDEVHALIHRWHRQIKWSPNA